MLPQGINCGEHMEKGVGKCHISTCKFVLNYLNLLHGRWLLCGQNKKTGLDEPSIWKCSCQTTSILVKVPPGYLTPLSCLSDHLYGTDKFCGGSACKLLGSSLSKRLWFRKDPDKSENSVLTIKVSTNFSQIYVYIILIQLFPPPH